jgi:N-formylglutamate amidohydrolase
MKKDSMDKYRFYLIFCCLSLLSCKLSGQDYTPGAIYYDSTGYVEYRAGNLPIILSAPHGGNLEPISIPDRDCAGCVTINDAYTKSIAQGLYEELYERTGCYPHLIINLLHRKKFDANRDIGDAADGNPVVEEAWYAYHNFIDAAKNQITEDYGRGFFLDLHGHAHTIQRIELGYLMSRDELQESDEVLNTDAYISESSVLSLINDNIQGIDHADLLRGPYSLGTLLDEKGFPSVPSLADPFPQDDEPFFQGGYNTQRHGSRDDSGSIDAIQIEMNQDIRFDANRRLELIDSLAYTSLEFYDRHYTEQFLGNYCDLIASIKGKSSNEMSWSLYPNPALEYVIVEGLLSPIDLEIFNGLGQLIYSNSIQSDEPIYLNKFQAGIYFVHVVQEGMSLGKNRLILIKD